MPVAITHFEFTQLPFAGAVTTLVNGVAATTGVLYPIAEQDLVTFERVPALNAADIPLLIFFNYRVHDQVNNHVSNTAQGTVYWSPNVGLPSSANDLIVMANGATENLLTNISTNEFTEYIEITSLEGIQNMKLNGVPLSVGQRLTNLEMFQTEFTTEAAGGNTPYFKMQYQVGNTANGLQPTKYEFQINVVVSADLTPITRPLSRVYSTEEFDVLGVPTTYDVITETLAQVLV